MYDNEHGVAKNAGHLDLMINYVNPGKVVVAFSVCREVAACALTTAMARRSGTTESGAKHMRVAGRPGPGR